MSTVMIHKAWEPYIFKTNLCRECRSFALSASDFLAVAVNCCQQLREREREREKIKPEKLKVQYTMKGLKGF